MSPGPAARPERGPKTWKRRGGAAVRGPRCAPAGAATMRWPCCRCRRRVERVLVVGVALCAARRVRAPTLRLAHFDVEPLLFGLANNLQFFQPCLLARRQGRRR